jgi:hypothetical protein
LILELALVLEVSPKPLGLGVVFILAGIVDGYFLGRENYGVVFEVPPDHRSVGLRAAMVSWPPDNRRENADRGTSYKVS